MFIACTQVALKIYQKCCIRVDCSMEESLSKQTPEAQLLEVSVFPVGAKRDASKPMIEKTLTPFICVLQDNAVNVVDGRENQCIHVKEETDYSKANIFHMLSTNRIVLWVRHRTGKVIILRRPFTKGMQSRWLCRRYLISDLIYQVRKNTYINAGTTSQS